MQMTRANVPPAGFVHVPSDVNVWTFTTPVPGRFVRFAPDTAGSAPPTPRTGTSPDDVPVLTVAAVPSPDICDDSRPVSCEPSTAGSEPPMPRTTTFPEDVPVSRTAAVPRPRSVRVCAAVAHSSA